MARTERLDMPLRKDLQSLMVVRAQDEIEVFLTAWGWMALVWGQGRLCRVLLPGGRRNVEREAMRNGPSVKKRTRSGLAQRCLRYFAGERVALSVPMEFPSASEFRRRVWEVTAQVPYGEVVTYGEVATRAGRPGAARAVGQAMAHNPLPLVVPCHRVVAANGGLGGFSAEGGLQLKRRLLGLEGVTPPWRTERGGRM